jgi:hypothetical protein
MEKTDKLAGEAEDNDTRRSRPDSPQRAAGLMKD